MNSTHTTAWAHLPNAATIADILADVKDRPEAWATAWAALHCDTREIEWAHAQDIACETIYANGTSEAWASLHEAVTAVEGAAYVAVCSAIDALVAWPDCDTPQAIMLMSPAHYAMTSR